MKNLLKPLAKSVFIPLGLAAALADTGIHKKVIRSETTKLVASNEEMKDIMKIVQSLEDSGLLVKRVIQSIENKLKEQRGGFLGCCKID